MRARATTVLNCLFTCLAIAVVVSACNPGERAGGVVHVQSEPVNGALVKLGNDTIGLTPCTIRGYPAGITGITLMHEQYQRTSQTVEIPESGEVTVTVKLQDLAGYLNLTSRPAHAAVTLDGTTSMGQTPLQRRPIPIGEHTYMLTLEDHESVSGELSIDDGLYYTLHHELKPIDGRISITSRPTGADIYVNDLPLGQKTPTNISLGPGDYTIAVHQEGYAMAEKAIRVDPNVDIDLEMELKEGKVPPGMVLIPAGEFTFGRDDEAPDERPAKAVYLRDYYIDKFEVTNAQYKLVVPGHSYSEKDALRPVSGVTWRQATDYAEAVGKRLPTEEEWEKAARGAEAREYPWGDRFEADRLNFVNSTGGGSTKPVGSYRAGASPYGCMDMAGNVYEWTADWYEPYPGNPIVETTYGQIYRVLRGGSFESEPYETRSARRFYDKPANSRPDFGFRCVKDPD